MGVHSTYPLCRFRDFAFPALAVSGPSGEVCFPSFSHRISNAFISALSTSARVSLRGTLSLRARDLTALNGIEDFAPSFVMTSKHNCCMGVFSSDVSTHLIFLPSLGGRLAPLLLEFSNIFCDFAATFSRCPRSIIKRSIALPRTRREMRLRTKGSNKCCKLSFWTGAPIKIVSNIDTARP